MESNKEIILITGITAFIGSQIGKLFVEKGKDKYRIRATARDMEKTKQLK